MCLRVNCKRCQKPTFTGCGKHVEQVLRDIEPQDRCQCRVVVVRTGTDIVAVTVAATA